MDEDAALSVSAPPDDGRLYPARPLLAASLAVVRDGRVLLARRARPPLAGLWSLPGGLVEPGETLREAALRETREEVGVEAEILGFNGHVEVIERAGERVRGHYVIASFVGRWVSGEGVPNDEVGAIMWAAAAEVARLPTTQGLTQVIERAFAMAGGQGLIDGLSLT